MGDPALDLILVDSDQEDIYINVAQGTSLVTGKKRITQIQLVWCINAWMLCGWIRL
jgi:hypothetical protein